MEWGSAGLTSGLHRGRGRWGPGGAAREAGRQSPVGAKLAAMYVMSWVATWRRTSQLVVFLRCSPSLQDTQMQDQLKRLEGRNRATVPTGAGVCKDAAAGKQKHVAMRTQAEGEVGGMSSGRSKYQSRLRLRAAVAEETYLAKNYTSCVGGPRLTRDRRLRAHASGVRRIPAGAGVGSRCMCAVL